MHLNLTVEQARVVTKALDLYSRVLCGQFHEITLLLRWRNRCDDNADHMIRTAERLLFPDGGIGIYSAPDDIKLAYDIYKTMMHILAPQAPVNTEPHVPITGQKIEITG